MIDEGVVLNERYRLDRLVGQGGFARVFLATDLLLRRQIAVKVLDAGLTTAGDEGDFLARFEREAQSVAALEHPNILGVYDYGRAAGTVYLVMPFVEGGSLHDRLRARGRLAPVEAAAYGRQAAAALDYAHRRGIVHRDIKPQNMLLRTEDDRLLLADFGIAKVLGRAGTDNRTGIMGTLSYMAPEQFQGEVSRATDVYALGCVLFQLLTGRLPFSGSPEQVMFGHVFGQASALDERGREWSPPALQAVVDRALAKEPAARFGSAGELAAAFAAAAGAPADGAVPKPPPPAHPVQPRTGGTTNAAPGAPPPLVGDSRPSPPAGQSANGAGTVGVVPATSPLTPPPPSLPVGGRAAPRPLLLAAVGAALALILLAALGAGAFTASRANRGATNPSPPTPTEGAVAVLTPAPTNTVPPAATVAPQVVAPSPTVAPTTATQPAPSATPMATPTAEPTAAPSPAPTATLTPAPTPAPTATAQPTAVPTPTASPTPRPTAMPTSPPALQGRAVVERALGSLPGTASSIVVAGDVVVGRDAERRMPAASVIKLFIAGEAYRQVAAGRLGLTDRFTVRQGDVVGGTGILQRQVGATYTLDEMVEIMLVESDNTAANMIIDRLGGFAPVNGFITTLGLSDNTRLNRKLLDTAAQARGIENTTTARDVATFYEQLRAGQVVTPPTSRRIVDILARRAGKDRDWLLLDLPPGVGVAHINGTNPGVRNDAAIIMGEAGPYILVVLVQHADEAAAERAIARVSLDIYNASRR